MLSTITKRPFVSALCVGVLCILVGVPIWATLNWLSGDPALKGIHFGAYWVGIVVGAWIAYSDKS